MENTWKYRKQTFKEIDFFWKFKEVESFGYERTNVWLLAKFGFGRFEKNVKKVHKGAIKPKHSQLFVMEMELAK